MSNKRAEQFNDFYDVVRAEWEHSNKPRSGQQIVEAQSDHSVRVQLNSETKTSFRILLSMLSTMTSGREIIPVGEVVAVLYDYMSMNGSNGPAFPIVVEPGDKEWPTAKMPECAFFMYAPQFHWTIAIGVQDRLARSIVGIIAHE